MKYICIGILDCTLGQHTLYICISLQTEVSMGTDSKFATGWDPIHGGVVII